MKSRVVNLCLVLATFACSSESIRNEKTIPSDKWILDKTLDIRGDSSALLYTNEAFIDAEIALPDIEQIHIKSKFIPVPNGSDSNSCLGYIINIKVKHLQKNEIPPKYLHKNEFIRNGKIIKLEPLNEVVYSVMFKFDYLDDNGFVLFEDSSSTQYIQSGRNNSIQDVVKTPINNKLTSRVKSIRPQCIVMSCESCR